MKYAKIQNGKVVATQQGIEPDGWVLILKQWERPSEYPSNFYSPTSNIPRLTVVGNEVHETWGFTLKSADSIKTEIYQAQKVERQAKQLGSFMVGELEVTLTDREDSLIISSLAEEPTKFKVAEGSWAVLTGEEVAALKLAHRTHVQTAYDWEMNSNREVGALSTLEDLMLYLGG